MGGPAGGRSPHAHHLPLPHLSQPQQNTLLGLPSLRLCSTARTAPLSAAPAVASGTFNPLCKVLCILQSLYLCAIGLMPDVLPCQGYTWHFKLQSQATLLGDTDGPSRTAATHGPA